jgi:CrcB protein
VVDELPDEVDRALVADARLHPGVIAGIAVGGAAGALARYGVTRVIHVAPGTFPRATFVTNVAGAFLLGCFLTVMHERRWSARYLRPLLAVGFLGAFTTFSTMAVESVTLVKDGDAGTGVCYLLVSVAVGLATCALGVLLGRAAARPRATGVA